MTGDFFGGSSPSTTCRSVRQTPQTSTRTSISPGPGSGFGSSTIARGLVSTFAGARRKQAFIVSPQSRFPPHTKEGGQHTRSKNHTQNPGGKKGGFPGSWFPELAHELAFRARRLYAELLMNNLTPETLMLGFISYIVFLFSTTCHEASPPWRRKSVETPRPRWAGRLV